MNNLINEIEKLVREAGKILIMANLKKEEIFDKEGPANFVTIYDRKIQQYLISEIKNIIPNAGFYGEEDTEDNKHENLNEGYVFYIDPIDGTTNFLFDYCHSCISVGISLNGEMIGGIIFNPYSNHLFRAYKGEGSFLNGKRLILSDTPLSKGVAEFGCARYNDDRVDLMMSVVKELFLRSICIRNGGSAALGISRIASGSNVLYFELMLQPYDYAAASVILEEAGGKICQADGKDVTFDKGCSIVAGTPSAVEECLSIMRIL